jgi:hypothetical protein
MLLGWVDDDSATMLMSIQHRLAHRMTKDRTYTRGEGGGEEIVIVDI